MLFFNKTVFSYCYYRYVLSFKFVDRNSNEKHFTKFKLEFHFLKVSNMHEKLTA